MVVLCRFCLLVVVCSVLELYRRVLHIIFVGFNFGMDLIRGLMFLSEGCEFGCGILGLTVFLEFSCLILQGKQVK